MIFLFIILQRAEIVTGRYEPTEEECKWEGESEEQNIITDESELPNNVEKKAEFELVFYFILILNFGHCFIFIIFFKQ